MARIIEALTRRRLGQLFTSFYTDRGSRYFYTPMAGEPVDKTRLTQLGIKHVPSYSPVGRARMERVFGTIRKRLPQELRLAGIDAREAANRYLTEKIVLPTMPPLPFRRPRTTSPSSETWATSSLFKKIASSAATIASGTTA